MKKASLAAVLCLIASGTALAGFKQKSGVLVDGNNRHAWGSLGTARNSADSAQYIGCTVLTYSDGSEAAWCGARDASYANGSCTTFAPAFINQIRQLKSDSYLSFYWDASYACTEVDVANQSYYEPKGP